MDALRGSGCDRSCSNASVQPKKVSNEFYGWDIRFKKTDGGAREGEAVDNLSEEFDPGSD